MSNVYADLGQIFAHSNMAEPRVAAYLWTGAPQWQIEALANRADEPC